jgi:UDPglucose 6-dehydrogenase
VKLAFIGLGKLGAPAAVTFAKAGHDVVGYDLAPKELSHPNLWVAPTVTEACDGAEVVFVAVQTPHPPGYGGEIPAPLEPKAFDTSYLRAAVEQVAAATDAVVAVVSTVLPGTCRAELSPLVSGPLVYHPFFIAMGSVEADIRHPEFVLLGSDDERAAATVARVYDPIHRARRLHVSIESAELAKVTYNTLISLKILAANSIMEIAEKTGADCDEVTGVLALATDRVVSSKYMRGGMGDGGSCHPRDAIAMQELARTVDLSADVFGFAVRAREAQTRWLAELVAKEAASRGLPVVVMGRSYKPGVDIEDGSAALLLGWYLSELDTLPIQVDDPALIPELTAVYVIAKQDREYTRHRFPAGSVVVDPWGIMPDRGGVHVHRIGRQ